MANSPAREAALRDAPYQQVKRDNTPKAAGMLAELSRHGPRTPPPWSNPSSPAPAPPKDYYYNPEDVTITRETPKPSPQKGKQPKVTTPSDWMGPTSSLPLSSDQRIVNPYELLEKYRRVGGGSPQRRDLEHLTPIPNPTKKSMDQQRPSIHPTTRRIEPSDANSPASPSPLRESNEGRSLENLTMLPSPSNEEGYLQSSILGDPGAQSISTSFRKLNQLYSNPPSTTTSPLAIYRDSEMSQQEAPDPNTMNLELDTRVVIPYEPPEKDCYEPGEAASIGRIENDEEDLLVEPSSFSGEGKDARRWLLAMKAFFWVNKEIFIDQRKVVTAFLNKLNKGRAVHFTEGWYAKLLDPKEEISAEECLEAFEKPSHPETSKTEHDRI